MISPLENSIQDFLLYIRSEKGLSRNTIEAYERDIRLFQRFLDEAHVVHFNSVVRENFYSFLEQLNNQQYASSSVARMLVSLKVLFKFLKREGIIHENISVYLDAPKLWQLIPEVLGPAEVDALLGVPDQDCPIGCRDAAILHVLYGSGLRVSEVCGLRIDQVDDTYIRVMGKGSKERIIPIGKRAIELIDRYLLQFRAAEGEGESKLLFLSRGGKGIDRIMVWRMIKKYALVAGINKRVSPHTLRHCFATHLLDNGADLRVIQDMLGHSNISSTDRYTHVSKKKLHDAFNKFHPRNSS
jgi:integrase/recombinase XerD